jgi:hypothetical protein
MTILPDLFLRALRFSTASLLLTLAACGPGTGGTGTGPIGNSLSYSGMASSSIGAGLSVGVPCTDNCSPVILRLDDEKVELDAPCHHFVYVGNWSTNANGLAELSGTLKTTLIVNNQFKTDTTSAVMRLQFSDGIPDSRQVTLTVRDANDRNLLSPLTLQRGDGTGAKSACTAGP